tara:strand:+ start:901 stop:1167 length:267 start_codon:yes stop_codon:yes gene_type:complete
MRVLDLQNFLSAFTASNKSGTAQGNAVSNAVIFVEVNGQLQEIKKMEVHEHVGPKVFGATKASHRLVLKTQKPTIPIILPDKLMNSDG